MVKVLIKKLDPSVIIPTYKTKDIPSSLKKIPITKPGSRFLK